MKQILLKLCLLSLSLLLLLSLVSCSASPKENVAEGGGFSDAKDEAEKVELGEGVLTGESLLPTTSEEQVRKISKPTMSAGSARILTLPLRRSKRWFPTTAAISSPPPSEPPPGASGMPITPFAFPPRKQTLLWAR